jgi:hypothetical protein
MPCGSNSWRSHVARLAAPCAVLLVALAIVAGCESRSRELQPGSYRAVLELPAGELPFGLDIAREESGFVLTLVNGEERVRITDVTVAEGRLTATMLDHENTLSVEIRGKRLHGELSSLPASGERQVLPFRAEQGQLWRFFAQPLTDNADVAGRWALQFTGDNGPQGAGVAEFTQSFERVTGTILTPTGDHRFLAGEVRGDELYLSRFDGTSTWLCKAKVDEDGRLVGECWSSKIGHQEFRAERNPDAVLDTSPTTTP